MMVLFVFFKEIPIHSKQQEEEKIRQGKNKEEEIYKFNGEKEEKINGLPRRKEERRMNT